MDLLQIVLRVIHIGAGIFWVGSATFLLVFVEPTMNALGPRAGAFMAHLNTARKMPQVIAVSALLTIAAGLALYWRDTSGFDPDLISTPFGIGLTVGAITAIAAFVIGLTMVRPRVERLGALGAAAGSGTATPDQLEELGTLQRSLRSISILNEVLLVVAVVAMVSARNL
jgi:hypothetical protein